MSGRFLERWSRLKKAADKVTDAEITDADSLLANLTPDSDFTQFLRQEISEEVRRKAMKTLFADPHFNVMDGLDTYIDDYSLEDPIPPEMMALLNQAKTLFGTPAGDAESEPGSAGVVATPSEAPAEPPPENESSA
jgi:hypothetical protein